MNINPFSLALEIIKYDQSGEAYFDRLIKFTDEYFRLKRECKLKADQFAIDYIRNRTASITSQFEANIVFS
ncbi:MAG: hypothetical protein DHS20C08_23850 [Rhodomicrobium sp.]|nr:MAG: hypothetical protein DHS20C08_23850 [Rhodomicrobium sp.]